MKQNSQNIMFLFILLLVSSLSCRNEEADVEKKIVSLFSDTIVQSSWKSTMWDQPERIVIEGDNEASENRMIVISKWDYDSLYFFFKVEDLCLRAYQTVKDHPKLYLDDMAEVLIDTQNNNDSCWAEDDLVYHVNLLGVKKDDRGSDECVTNPKWDGNANIRLQLLGTLNDTTDIDRGFLITVSFSWEEIKQEPHPGLIMGVNFANGDNDGKGRQLFDWVGAWPMRSPYAYGNLILKKQ